MSALPTRTRVAWAGAGVLAIVAALGGSWLVGASGSAESPVADVAAPAPPPVVAAPRAPWRWSDDLATVYTLEWRHSGAARADALGDAAGGDNVDGAILLRGELAVAVAERDADGAYVLAVTLPTVTHLAWRVMGTDVPPEEAIGRYFTGQRVYLAVDATGAPGELRFPPETPRPFAQVVTPLVRQAFPRPGPAGAERWSEVAATGLGRAATRWEVGERTAPGTLVLSAAREAADYEEQEIVSGVASDALAGQGRGTFALAGGRLERVAAREHLEVLAAGARVAMADVSVRLDYLRTEPAGGNLAAADAVPLAALPDTARDNALEKRMRGMTFEQLAADLRRFGPGGVMPRHNAWLWRTTGWLHRYPERTGEVAALFWDPAVGPAGQALVLDLLASVGHGPAQGALRGILDDERVSQRFDYHANLQRLVLVSHPEPATVALVQRQYTARVGDDAGRAAAVTLGAMAARGVLDADGIVRGLVADLDGAVVLDDQRALVRALGASRSPVAEEALAARLRDPRAILRAEAARALATWDDPRAGALLADAVARERDPVGQKWGLVALAEHPPTPAALDALAALLARGDLDGSNVYEALRLAEKAAAALGPQAVWPVAQALRSAGVGDRAARSKVNSWVEGIRAEL